MPPAIASRTLSTSACVTICRARRADRQPHRRLRPARHRAREQQVGDVGARDQQHQAADAEQDLQAAAVLLLHHADAGAGRHDGDRLLGQQPDRRPASSWRDSRSRAASSGAARRSAAAPCRRPRRPAAAGRSRAATPKPAGAAASCRRRSAAPGCSGIHRSGGSPRSVSPKKPGGATPITRERMALDDERRADDRRVAAVGASARRDGSGRRPAATTAGRRPA